MKLIHHITGFSAALALGACSTATTVTAPVSVPSVGSAAYDATTGGYSVTVNGTTTDMGIRTNLTLGGLIWDNADTLAFAFTNADVEAAAGGLIKPTTTTFAGVTGTAGTVPTSGSATYAGRIGLVGVDPIRGNSVYTNSLLELTADFAGLTVSQNTGSVTIAGTISGSAFTGTVGWSGLSAPMAGGFYGTNTAAGAFASAELAGAFLGTKP